MKLFVYTLFVYIYFDGAHGVPTGLASSLVDGYNGVLAVPAIPRFPVKRPKPEATTFFPLKDDVIDTEYYGSGDESSSDIIEENILPNDIRCRLEYQTVFEVEEVETQEEKCETVNE